MSLRFTVLAAFLALTSAFTAAPSAAPAPATTRAAASPIMAMTRRAALASLATAAVAPTAAFAKGPKNSVTFTNVKDGDTVPTTFTYKMDVTGYSLSPAAEGLKEGTGHHHLIIDGPDSFVTEGEAIPMDATHKHYGKAQTEGTLELEPGKHKITMQFANAYHQSYGKAFAKTITVNVKG